MRRAALVSLVLAASAAGAGAAQPRAEAERFPVLPVAFAVAEIDGQPVASPEWLAAQVDQANAIFAPSGVSFQTADVHALADAHARLETRRDRHALGAEVRPAVINCFVVVSLRDVDTPDRYRMGVHWRPRGHPGRHLVIITGTAGPTVLAHELGHFFGNHRHSETPNNIMSYARDGTVPPFFDDAQVSTIRRSARAFLRRGELVPAAVARDSGG